MGLVLVSLVLITVYFRESPSGALHDAQGGGATVLRPFQVGAERVARPFQDAYGWAHDLVVAKRENERLKRELAAYRQERIQAATLLASYRELRRQVKFADLPLFPFDYERIVAPVIAPATQYRQEIVIAAGSEHGVRKQAPVVTDEGLVGQVTLVYPNQSKVMLITDSDSAVAARDLETKAWGIVERGPGGPGSLILNRVLKSKRVRRGDRIVTAGSAPGSGLRSIFPRGIGIGEVEYVGQTSTDVFKRIQIRPFVDTSSLDMVMVLRPLRLESKPR